MKLYKVTKNERDKKRRIIFNKLEKKRRIYDLIKSNLKLSKKIRYQAFSQLQKFPKNSSETRLKNRCIFTGRSKGVSRYHKISRHKFREWANMGLLNGIRKSTW